MVSSSFRTIAVHGMRDHWPALGFCVVLSFSFVLMSLIVRTYSPLFASFATYTITALVFVLVRIRMLRKLLEVCRRHARLVLLINLATLVNTVLAYVVLQYITPISYLIVFFGVTPVMASWLANDDTARIGRVQSLLLLPSSVVFGWLANPQLDAVSAFFVATTLVASFSGASYMRWSSLLQRDAALASADIMAIRFGLTALVCGVLFEDDIGTIAGNPNALLFIFMTALMGSILPLFLMQVSLRRIGLEKTAAWFPVVPVLCILASSVMGLLVPNGWMVAASLAFAMVTMFSARLKNLGGSFRG